jgi:hypothetical protein
MVCEIELVRFGNFVCILLGLKYFTSLLPVVIIQYFLCMCSIIAALGSLKRFTDLLFIITKCGGI